MSGRLHCLGMKGLCTPPPTHHPEMRLSAGHRLAGFPSCHSSEPDGAALPSRSGTQVVKSASAPWYQHSTKVPMAVSWHSMSLTQSPLKPWVSGGMTSWPRSTPWSNHIPWWCLGTKSIWKTGRYCVFIHSFIHLLNQLNVTTVHQILC